MKKDYAVLWVLFAYLVGGVVCFGPATVQSEQARETYQAKCRAEHAGDIERQRLCPIGGPSISDGAAKAMFWPLWLSYMVASN